MVADFLRSVPIVAAAAGAVLTALSPAAAADGDVHVFPGMEIRQGTTVCTLGFIDPVARIGYSAGHCRGNGTVTDRDGRLIGTVTTARDNTPNGAVVRTDQVISDYVGPRLRVDIHIDVDGEMTLRQVHAISDQVQARVEALPAVDLAFVHVEPAGS